MGLGGGGKCRFYFYGRGDFLHIIELSGCTVHFHPLNERRHSFTRARVPPVALHVSQQISSQSWGFSGVAAAPCTTTLKGPVAPVALQLPGVSHVKLPLKRCRATGGCSSYTCGCRATLCNYERGWSPKKNTVK